MRLKHKKSGHLGEAMAIKEGIPTGVFHSVTRAYMVQERNLKGMCYFVQSSPFVHFCM